MSETLDTSVPRLMWDTSFQPTTEEERDRVWDFRYSARYDDCDVLTYYPPRRPSIPPPTPPPVPEPDTSDGWGPIEDYAGPSGWGLL